MSPLKLICVAATLAASVAATSAFADCSRSQEVELGKITTRAVADQVGGVQHQKQITIHDCDAGEGDVIRASFVYNYFDADGLQTVSGTVEAAGGKVTALDTATRDRRVASRDTDYDYTNQGRYSYR